MSVGTPFFAIQSRWPPTIFLPRWNMSSGGYFARMYLSCGARLYFRLQDLPPWASERRAPVWEALTFEGVVSGSGGLVADGGDGRKADAGEVALDER
jgi:hypothetical protein